MKPTLLTRAHLKDEPEVFRPRIFFQCNGNTKPPKWLCALLCLALLYCIAGCKTKKKALVPSPPDTATVYWEKVTTDENIPFAWQQVIQRAVKQVLGKPVDSLSMQTLVQPTLRKAQNQGYPFASLQLHQVDFPTPSAMQASLLFNPGPLVTFDTVVVVGDIKIAPWFLGTYLGFNKGRAFSAKTEGQLFNQHKVDKAGVILGQLPYLTVEKPPEVFFEYDKAYVKLFLKERKAGQVDGFVGLQSANAPGARTTLTGQFALSLQNLFGQGKSFSARWQRIKPESPLYELSYGHPMLFKLPVDLRVHLFSLKEDTLFFNLTQQAGLQYRLGPYGKMGLAYHAQSTRGLSQQQPADLPERQSAGLQTRSVGWQYQFNRTDDFFFPRKGLALQVQALTGTKRITSLNLPDSLPGSTRHSQLFFNVQGYVPLGQKSTLQLKNQSGTIISPVLFANDLHRLGGLNSLRGFNENTFFTSAWTVQTIEYRFYWEAGSYFLLFSDQAILQQQVLNTRATQTPWGLGAGLSLGTKSGLFSLVYSIGRNSGEAFQWNRAKIHFGFVSIF
jgi:outer membrane protein assembly factor BamA